MPRSQQFPAVVDEPATRIANAGAEQDPLRGPRLGIVDHHLPGPRGVGHGHAHAGRAQLLGNEPRKASTRAGASDGDPPGVDRPLGRERLDPAERPGDRRGSTAADPSSRAG